MANMTVVLRSGQELADHRDTKEEFDPFLKFITSGEAQWMFWEFNGRGTDPLAFPSGILIRCDAIDYIEVF